MEDKYRELLSASKKNDGRYNNIFVSSWIYKDYAQVSQQVSQEAQEIKAKESESQGESLDEGPNKVTEKTVILDSLNLFAEDKLKEEDRFSFKGGSLGAKKTVSSSITHDLLDKSFDLVELTKRRFKRDSLLKRFSENHGPKVFFITDDSLSAENSQDADFDLQFYFNQEVSTLFSNMIKAMNLKRSEYYISSLSFNQNQQKEDLIKEIYFLDPELIITLGAKATNFILQSNMRLKDCHGQFQNMAVDDKTFTVMPLFSPSLLHTAPNMKKLAWTDMQKAMAHLNI